MVEVGTLVREHCHPESPTRLGTIVKVTQLELTDAGKAEILHHQTHMSDLNRTYDPDTCDIIRPGKVFSVRWQDNPAKITVHVVYDDCKGLAIINLGSNSVEVIS